MAKTSRAPALPQGLSAQWQATVLRVKAALSARHLWENVLTDAERQQLGGDLEAAFRQYGTAGMWKRLRGVSNVRAVLDVARALNLLDEGTYQRLLRATGEVSDDAEEAIQRAVESGALVLVERPRQAYWDGRCIPIDWARHSVLWHFLWELARLAKAGQPIDRLHLGQGTDTRVVAKQKSRLLTMDGFPVTLGDCIKSEGRGTQRLQLPPERIRLFQVESVEHLRERLA